MSVTHISEIANAESILTRVGSAKMEKKQTILSRTSPSGTYSLTKSFVRLSKKEKIVIGAVIGVIVAMFVLIIVNSAILSGITADVSSLPWDGAP